MDMDFVVICQLVRHRMPQIRFLYIGSYVCSTLLSDPASRRRPCASLALHLHQVGQGTSTPKLSNMFGTQKKSRESIAALTELLSCFYLSPDWLRFRIAAAANVNQSRPNWRKELNRVIETIRPRI